MERRRDRLLTLFSEFRSSDVDAKSLLACSALQPVVKKLAVLALETSLHIHVDCAVRYMYPVLPAHHEHLPISAQQVMETCPAAFHRGNDHSLHEQGCDGSLPTVVLPEFDVDGLPVDTRSPTSDSRSFREHPSSIDPVLTTLTVPRCFDGFPPSGVHRSSTMTTGPAAFHC
ncbi:hypothetical protein P152DRAFT_18748 [Eremomyces bilateralis CBS 781.70]|uniref:Uncharacterized protein n=1 Tax=Eremomyces bilateralis CBS 781.70 TaxID=1392243 RepID=A0A6G1GHE6_9PEZI|nr:uncharacterized protein P152DRAFT_18748 [Eremomyces bilateralis CBS 781.70]KAF1817434.1 hypothetical protein P152DRAFT_18748 [Eremomyces bilateralis CBS 781.70]